MNSNRKSDLISAMVGVTLAFGVAIGVSISIARGQPVTVPQKEYQFRGLSAKDIDLIGKGLGTQPFGEVTNLMNRLQQQIINQDSIKEEPKAAEPKPTEEGK